MNMHRSHFDRWNGSFNIQPRSVQNPIKIMLRICKWIVLFSCLIIFFWGMGTLFFNKNVTVSQIEMLNEKGEKIKTYSSGVFFELISGYDRALIYKQHIFHFVDGNLYEYDYLAVDNIDDIWEYSVSPFYALFVLPTSWILTKITELLKWNKNGLGSNYNLMVMIFSIFLTSLILRIITGVGSWKQQKNKNKMNLLQGKVSEIKNKYKEATAPEAKQKMQWEIMALYRQEKVNPLSSSLEGFAFAPFLFAMFVVVRTNRVLKDSGTATFSFTATIWDSLTQFNWIYLIPSGVYLLLMLFDTFAVPRILAVKQKVKSVEGDKNKGFKKWLFKWGFKILFIVFFFIVPVGTSVYWIFSSFFEIWQKFLLFFVQKIHKNKAIAKKRGKTFQWWNIKYLLSKN